MKAPFGRAVEIFLRVEVRLLILRNLKHLHRSSQPLVSFLRL
jgi:hypothetical protein